MPGLYNYCTLFDSFYLSRGLVMYESLKATSKDFHLFIFAFDELTEKILNNMALSSVTVVSLSDFETAELKEVKKVRTKAEYCWTCTPSTISYVFQKFGVNHCTYIDSDLIFYSDPSVLVIEMYESDKTVLITEHRFAALPRIYEEKRGGRFCVQFITFTDVEDSQQVLEMWRTQCIDWCFARYEHGKFGDQKYLDEWPRKYNNIHILRHLGGGLAPWNITRYKFRTEEAGLTGINRGNGKKFMAVFYHFQYVKFLDNGQVDVGWYYLPAEVLKHFYFPYLKLLSIAEKILMDTFEEYKTGITYFKSDSLKNLVKIGFKKISGYNLFKLN